MTTGSPRLTQARTTTIGVAIVLAAAYAWFASLATPFTLAADLTTAVPLAGLAATYVAQRLRPMSAIWGRLPADRPPRGGAAAPWIVVAGVLVASELVSYFGGGRSSHPTLSSLSDSVFRWHAAKAAAYLVWLWLAWHLVRR